jgi:hypothetical protein
VSAGTVGIVELVEVCAAEHARSMSLFERVGGWVATTDDAALQRLFATAAHRHAWHAELWAGRAPAIPVAAVAADVAAIADATGDVDRWTAYVTALGSLDADLAALAHRVDPDLDPGTARVVSLVASDVRALAAQLASVHVA